jgi:hypothetical protein
MIEELKQAEASEDLPYSVGEHEHVYGLNLRTRDELLAIAKDYGVPVTSRIKRGELLDAVKERLNGGERSGGDEQTPEKADGIEAQLQSKTRDDLYKLAGEHHINGRSNMNKAELTNALASEIRHSGARSGL